MAVQASVKQRPESRQTTDQTAGYGLFQCVSPFNKIRFSGYVYRNHIKINFGVKENDRKVTAM